MVLAINYANEKFKPAQKFNSKRALKFGADKVIEYSPSDIDEKFRNKNKEIFAYPRGNGYWIWKAYFILQSLEQVKEGEYVLYTDSGSAFVNKIEYLIQAMNNANTDVMVFSLVHPEKYWTKRDAFVLMECDRPDIVESPQICGTYFLVKKTDASIAFVKEWLSYVQDKRIVTDEPNVMGLENYEGFQEHRHDQSVLSLLCKKHGIQPFRDPSEWGLNLDEFSDDIIARSTYPQVIESHRNPNIRSVFQLKYKTWYKYFDRYRYIEQLIKIKHKVFG